MLSAVAKPWPDLAFENWKDTLATVHLWTQIVGKIRLKQMPWLNHSACHFICQSEWFNNR